MGLVGDRSHTGGARRGTMSAVAFALPDQEGTPPHGGVMVGPAFKAAESPLRGRPARRPWRASSPAIGAADGPNPGSQPDRGALTRAPGRPCGRASTEGCGPASGLEAGRTVDLGAPARGRRRIAEAGCRVAVAGMLVSCLEPSHVLQSHAQLLWGRAPGAVSTRGTPSFSEASVSEPRPRSRVSAPPRSPSTSPCGSSCP